MRNENEVSKLYGVSVRDRKVFIRIKFREESYKQECSDNSVKSDE